MGKLIIVGLVALIIGAVGGAGWGMLQVDEANQKLAVTTQEKEQAVQVADRLRKTNDEASKKYGKDLGKLVMAAGAAATPQRPPQQRRPHPPPDSRLLRPP